MTENSPDEISTEEQNVAELEEKLLDAMRTLRRKNKKVEEYLDGLARTAEKPVQEGKDEPRN